MKKIEKIDRGILGLNELRQGTILDKLDEIVERLNEQKKENERISARILALEKRVAEHTHLANLLPSC